MAFCFHITEMFIEMNANKTSAYAMLQVQRGSGPTWFASIDGMCLGALALQSASIPAPGHL